MRRATSVIVAALLATAALRVSAQSPVPTGPSSFARIAAKKTSPSLLPGTRTGLLTTIQGNALNATNGSLPDSLVRLRDARFGRIVDTQMTDKSGLFAFKVMDPGSYVVEIVNPADSAVLAASQLINVNLGEAVTAVVKLPFRPSLLGGVLGNTAPQAVAVTTSAATSGILSAVIANQAEPVSP
jgi:hypothetical protein